MYVKIVVEIIGGGAGNPSGGINDTPYYNANFIHGSNGTGGLLIIYSKLNLYSGNILSCGSGGWSANDGSHNNSGGSSGGGSINVFFSGKLYNGIFNVSRRFK